MSVKGRHTSHNGNNSNSNIIAMTQARKAKRLAELEELIKSGRDDDSSVDEARTKQSKKHNKHSGKKHMSYEGYKPYEYGSYSGGTGYTGTTYTAKTCKHPPTAVKAGDVEIYACRQSDVDLAISGGFDVISPLVSSPTCKEFENFYGMLLWFPIVDYQAPDPVRLRLHALRLIRLARAGSRVVTYCIGSHGRTGTVLATCIGLLEPDVDPIDTVRERHCKDAVESQRQVEAIFEALERELPEKWKPAPIVKPVPPLWVKKGEIWTSGVESAMDGMDFPTDDTGEINKCDYCKTAGALSGINQLHWFGKIRSHMDCYERHAKKVNDARAAEAAAKQAASHNVSTAVPPVGANYQAPEEHTPTVHTPSSLLKSAQQQQLPAVTGSAPKLPEAEDDGWHWDGHYDPKYYDAKPLPESSTKSEEEEGVEVVLEEEERPFRNNWTARQKWEHKGALNDLDQFGDLICPSCRYLIIDPDDTIKNGQTLVHADCNEAKKTVECSPLCVGCSDGFVDNPLQSDYCKDCETLVTRIEDVEKTEI